MTCHRYTLVLILITVSILTSVITAFRVRLPHENVKQKCDSCDSKDLNRETKQNLVSDGKRVYDELKKTVRDKLRTVTVNVDDSDEEDISTFFFSAKSTHGQQVERNVLEEADIVTVSEEDDEEEDDNDNNVKYDDGKKDIVNDKNKPKTILKKTAGHSEMKKTKPLFELKIDDDDDDDDSDDEDDDDDTIQSNIKIVTPKESTVKQIDPVKKTANKVVEKQIKTFTPKKTDTDKIDEAKLRQKAVEKIKEAAKIVNQQNMETKSKEEKPQETLEKIKVKSHIEGGKLHSHVIASNPKEDDKDSDKNSESNIELKKTDVSSKETIKSDKKKLKNDVKESDQRPISDAIQRKLLLQSEFEDFYAYFPTFAPNFSRVHNPECRRHGQILLRQLRGSKLWALNMLDATAKMPSGILQGNVVQLGDFDQCLASRARVQLETGSVVKVQGKYCLVTMDVKSDHPDLEVPVNLVQGRNLIKSRVDDPGHFVPRFSTLSWGTCVPSPCSSDDVEVIVKDAIKHYQKIGISFRVNVDDFDCHVQKSQNWDNWIEIPTLLTLSFYAVIILLVVVTTAKDLLADGRDQNGEEDEVVPNKKSDGFLSGFSLCRTTKKLVAPAGDEEVPSIHGVRAIATIALVVAHKFLPVAYMPYTNRIKLAEVVSSPLWSWCRVGWIFTDCFLLLSGALHAYRTTEKSSAFEKLCSKYLRLTPALLAVVWFYAYVWDQVSVGPMWGSLVTKNAEICQSSWWWNLFYLQNYYGLDDMCAPQTHQLALDMQLALLGAVILWAIQYDIVGSKFIIPLIQVAAAYSRYTTFQEHRLTMIAYHGVSVSQLYRTGRMSYTSVFHRCTSYLLGLYVGMALRNTATISKPLVVIGWLVAVCLGAAVVWAGFDSGHLDYQYNATFAAQYAALAPIACAVTFGWLLFTAHNRYSETLSNMLCSRPLLLISRLSYAIYLTQFIVFLTNAATVKTSREFTVISVIDVQEILAIIILSTVLTLTLVIPMQSLPNIFKAKSKNDDNEIDETENKTLNNTENIEEQIKTNSDSVSDAPTLNRPLLAHRELLEEIPEDEIEYKMERAPESLEEILEEDDDSLEDEMQDRTEDDDLEIIEEEQDDGDHWAGDGDDWELTGSNRSGAQYYRYAR